MPKLLTIGVALILSLTPIIFLRGDVPEQLSFTPYENLSYDTKKQVDCLANNIYFEARNQSLNGQIAVGLVTINRVNSGVFPSSICAVVKQKTSKVCQFSWWCDAKIRAKSVAKDFIGAEQQLYQSIRHLAINIYLNHHILHDITYGATFYHATYISPRWLGVERTTQIDQHIFYRKTDNDKTK